MSLLEKFGPAYRDFVGSQLPRGHSPARLRAMAELAEKESMTMSELRRRVGGSAQNVTKLVDALEKEGAVVRRPHASDRRATLVELTEQTRQWALEARQEHRRAVATLFEALDESHRRAFASGLEALLEELERRS